jgi:hypothetical protein
MKALGLRERLHASSECSITFQHGEVCSRLSGAPNVLSPSLYNLFVPVGVLYQLGSLKLVRMVAF